MADIFGRTDQILKGGLSSDSMFMTWPELAAVGGGLGMMIQRVGLDYMQPLRRVFEIGPGVVPVDGGGFTTGAVCDVAAPPDVCAFRTQPTYYIVGRPEGSLQASQFIGPDPIGVCFYRKYGSPCGPNVITLTGKAGCSAADPSAKRVTWSMNGVTTNRLNMDVNGQEMVMQAGFSAMFAGLNMTIDGNTPLCGDNALAAVVGNAGAGAFTL